MQLQPNKPLPGGGRWIWNAQLEDWQENPEPSPSSDAAAHESAPVQTPAPDQPE